MKKSYFGNVKFLYGVIICLFGLIIGLFFFFQRKLNIIQKDIENNYKMSITGFKRLTNVIELNYLDTENFKYLVNSSNWSETLKRETLLNFDDLENFQVEKVIVRQENEMGPDDLSEFIITMNILNNSSFKDFTDLMYQKINKILVITDNDTSKVESFKEGRGYYDINSFEEATYNNMYYDYMKTMSDGSIGGPKIKVKILYMEETNQIKIEINKF